MIAVFIGGGEVEGFLGMKNGIEAEFSDIVVIVPRYALAIA